MGFFLTQGQPTHPMPASGQRVTTVYAPTVTGQSPQPLAPTARPVGTVLVPDTQEDRRNESQERPRQAPHPVRQQDGYLTQICTPPQGNTSMHDMAVCHSNNHAGTFNPLNYVLTY